MRKRVNFRAWLKQSYEHGNYYIKYESVYDRDNEKLVFVNIEYGNISTVPFHLPFNDTNWVVEEAKHGLDRKGNVIYPSDILITENHFEEDPTIEGKDIDNWYPRLLTTKEIDTSETSIFNQKFLIVIGNKFENPEMLDEKFNIDDYLNESRQEILLSLSEKKYEI